jgi:CheY-like chemotaxis protein
MDTTRTRGTTEREVHRGSLDAGESRPIKQFPSDICATRFPVTALIAQEIRRTACEVRAMSLEPVSPENLADIAPQAASTDPDRILVVDDDEGICRYVGTVLKGAGYEVLYANSGEAALRICDQDPAIKLILADVVMPNLGGRRLASHIGSSHSQIKVILMSGYPNVSGLLNGIASRTEKIRSECNFILKPFSPGELTRKVREILSQQASTMPSQSM